ncbi:MAG: hypothetical protein H6709_01790 [Kofleriaceae bacterium]|nr:hypothetical protein [Kofleriaceae bacterium]MCB9570801.1 hypothetical protein [Kofleriaceae bacterium]
MSRLALRASLAAAASTALALLAAACGPTNNFHVAVGFAGTIGTCRATAATGATTLDDRGRVHGASPGHGEVVCEDGDREGVGVAPLARVAIEGPDEIAPHTGVYYTVRAYAADGTGLSLIDDDQIGWSATGGDLQPAHCSDMPLLGCPGPDSAQWMAPGPGTYTLEATYLGQRATRHVVVR